MKVMFGLKKIFGSKRNGIIKKRWTLDTKQQLVAPPSVSALDSKGAKSIVFGTKEGKIYSLDKDSKVNWMFDAKEEVDDVELMFLDTENANSIEAAPNIKDIDGDGKKEVVFGSEMGTVFALDTNGKALWKFKAQDAVRGGINIKDIDGDGKPEIIFGSSDKNLYILDAKGKLKQTIETGEEIEATPETVEDKIIVGTRKGTVKAFTLEGKELWKFKTKDRILAKPTIGKIHGDKRDIIIIGSLDQYLYALTLDGELEWKFKTQGAIYSQAALADINNDKKLEVVFGSCDNNIYAIDPYGIKIWNYETDFWIVAPVIVTDIDNDGNLEIVAGSYDHNLYVLDAKGNYMLNYVPGLSGLVHQTGSYSDIATQEAEMTVGKKLWQYQTEGIIVGCAVIEDDNEIVINTEHGSVNNLGYEKRG